MGALMNTYRRELILIQAQLKDLNNKSEVICRHVMALHNLVQVIDWYMITNLNGLDEADCSIETLRGITDKLEDYTTFLERVSEQLDIYIRAYDTAFDFEDEEMKDVMRRYMEGI